jgi:electron transfer flavoprotein alpha subunit
MTNATQERGKNKTHQGVWIFAEHKDGHLHEVALELLNKGRELADQLETDLSAVLLGYQVEGFAPQLSACGADRVYLSDDPLLENYHNEAHVSVLERLIKTYHPEILLLGATMVGLDLAPSLAARMNTGLAAHCIDLELDREGHLVQIVPAVGVATAWKILCPEHYPQMATVRPGTFSVREVPDTRDSQIVAFPAEINPDQLRMEILEQGPLYSAEDLQLENAKVAVAGGAGIGGIEGWQLIEQLAEVLGGMVGATRPAVDEGWASLSQMIGHSGKTVSPKLYLGVGISGDMLHMVGIKDAQVAIAINNDPKAPIFQEVDFGIVGDFRKIVPLLIRELGGEL